VVTVIPYFASRMSENAKAPAEVVVATYAGFPEESIRLIVTVETGAPVASRNTPVHETVAADAIELNEMKTATTIRRR